MNKQHKTQSGFTLAEVLITLGIIGIVAALTLPMLIASNKEKARVTNLKKIYSQIQNAWNLAVYENGPVDTWDLTKTLTGEVNENGEQILDNSGRIAFMQHLEPYFKKSNINKVNIEGRYSLDGRGIYDNASYKTDGGATDGTLITADGFVLKVGWINNNSDNIADFWVTLPNEKKEIIGVTFFNFNITQKGIVPNGRTQSSFKQYCDVKSTAQRSDMNGRGCTAWALWNENMEYTKCNDLSFNGKKKCH